MEGLPEGVATPDPVSENAITGGRVVLRREKARRSGKTVVVVSGFPDTISDSRIEGLAREARHHCGCGGTVRLREIELQGDQPERVRQFFEREGFRVGGLL